MHTRGVTAESPAQSDAVLRQAMELHRAGRLDEARLLYEQVLAVQPQAADALHFLGVLRYAQGEAAAGEALVRQALEAVPGYADAHNNLGNMLEASGRHEAAAASYRRALELQPDNASAHNNLAVSLKLAGRLAESESAFRKAIALAPRVGEFRANLGHLLQRLGREDEALRSYREAVACDPANRGTRRTYAAALCHLGRLAEARTFLAQWLEEDPASDVARHMAAACGGEGVPARAPDGYVRALFDDMAALFDEKLAHLGYRTPELLVTMLTETAAVQGSSLAVLDAGCGTGLCGALLRPHASRLEGVDLSPAMLRKARERAVYDRLALAELTAHLAAATAGSWDLVVSADTLCYFGDLWPVMGAAAHALRPGGRLAFTVERLTGAAPSGYVLNPHGRYAHTRRYVREALARAGLDLVTLRDEVLRMERGRPVEGFLVLARRPAVGLPA